MKDIVWLHGLAMRVGVFVLWVVVVGLFTVVTNTFSCRYIYNAHRVEVAWTGVPILLLVRLGVPSIRLLYKMDEMVDPVVTIKAIGHQWYWSYEFGDFGNFEFDSYMSKVGDGSNKGAPIVRLLEVDKRLVVPVGVQIRMIVSSNDVIHSWALPELGIKMDGVPGRLNQIGLKIARPGVYRGMCSELCGVNHAFMPIVLEAVPMREFMRWAKKGQALL